MGRLEIFYAGIGEGLPLSSVNNVLINTPAVGKTEGSLRQFMRKIQVGQVKTIMLDSGGFQLLKAEEENIEEPGKVNMSFDPAAPLKCKKNVEINL